MTWKTVHGRGIGSPREFARAVLVLSLVLLAACVGRDSDSSATTSAGEGAVGGHWVFALSPDHPTFEAEFNAADPTVMVTDTVITAPAGAALSGYLGTTGSARLNLQTSGRACEPQGDEVTCTTMFPFLEAQRAGTWTIHLETTSAVEVEGTARVTFARP